MFQVKELEQDRNFHSHSLHGFSLLLQPEAILNTLETKLSKKPQTKNYAQTFALQSLYHQLVIHTYFSMIINP